MHDTWHLKLYSVSRDISKKYVESLTNSLVTSGLFRLGKQEDIRIRKVKTRISGPVHVPIGVFSKPDRMTNFIA